MSDTHKDIVLSPIIAHKREILRALHLPNKCYWIFYKKDNKYKELAKIDITGKYTHLENINKYYNYTGDIKNPTEFDDIKYSLENGALKLQLELELEEE